MQVLLLPQFRSESSHKPYTLQNLIYLSIDLAHEHGTVSIPTTGDMHIKWSSDPPDIQSWGGGGGGDAVLSEWSSSVPTELVY